MNITQPSSLFPFLRRAHGMAYWQSLVFRSWLADKIGPKGWYLP